MSNENLLFLPSYKFDSSVTSENAGNVPLYFGYVCFSLIFWKRCRAWEDSLSFFEGSLGILGIFISKEESSYYRKSALKTVACLLAFEIFRGLAEKFHVLGKWILKVSMVLNQLSLYVSWEEHADKSNSRRNGESVWLVDCMHHKLVLSGRELGIWYQDYYLQKKNSLPEFPSYDCGIGNKSFLSVDMQTHVP